STRRQRYSPGTTGLVPQPIRCASSGPPAHPTRHDGPSGHMTRRPDDQMQLDLSIIIVSFNAREDLTRCVQSIVAHPPAATHEIVVVDNASGDGSADAAAAFESVTVI